MRHLRSSNQPSLYMILEKGANRLLDIVYPPMCLSCDASVSQAHRLCLACAASCTRISGAACEICATPLTSLGNEGIIICDECLKNPRPWQSGFAATLYEGSVKRLVLGLKNGGCEENALLMAEWLAPKLKNRHYDYIIPVPMHWKKWLIRRHNPAADIAEALSERLAIQSRPDFLSQAQYVLQKGKSAIERKASLENMFRLHHKALLKGKSVLLVDDVMTTGATLESCSKTLLNANLQRIDIAIFAKVIVTSPQINT